MPLLVRKINKAKWMRNGILEGEEIPADAITNCLKTTGNTLSTWQISGENEVVDAVLAIVSAGQHPDTIDVVFLNPSCLERERIKLQQTPGNTPVKDLIERHVDICDLTYRSLGTVAKQIVDGIREDKVFRYTTAKILTLLRAAIDSGRIERDGLHESLVKKL